MMDLKLKKLKIAYKLAITKNKKKSVLSDAESLKDEVDSQIKSIAVNKFAVMKARRLKKLGKTHEEVNALISNIASSEDNILDRGMKALSGFGIDKKFVDLSAEEILEKLNVVKPINNEPAVDFNERIYDFLVTSGDVNAAEYVQEIMEDSGTDDTKKISDVREHTEHLSKLTVVNQKIFEKIDEIEKDMTDEQDTSLDTIPAKLQQAAVIEQQVSEPGEKQQKQGFLESILRAMFGDTIVDLLITAKDILPLAISLLSPAMGWLSKKVGGMFKTLFQTAIKPFSLLLNGLKLSFNAISEKFGMLKDFALKSAKGVAGPVIDKVKKSINNVKEVFNQPEKKQVKGVPEPDKVEKPDSIKKNNEKIKKKPTPKLSKSKPTGILKKLGRFAKPIPILGTAIAAGTAIYSAQDGYNNASEYLGKDEKNITEIDKVAAAAGALVNDVTFGVISTRDTAERIISWVDSSSKDKIIEKYQNDLKIIDYDTFGNSEVLNWDKFSRLSSDEMQELISLDDWDDTDLKMMEVSLKNKISTSPEKLVDESSATNYNRPEKKETESSTNRPEKKETVRKSEVVNNFLDPRVDENTKKISELIIQKNKSMINVEENYTKLIKNTKSYDSGVKTQIGQTSVSNINNISSKSNAKATPNALQIFDK